MELPTFLQDEQCQRCKGPIVAEPHTKTDFHQATADYVSHTVWFCYACGLQQTLDGSQPYYAL